MNQIKEQERPMSILRALLHFFGPGCMEDFKRGWNAAIAASEEVKIAQSTMRVNHAAKGGNDELFSGFHFRQEDSISPTMLTARPPLLMLKKIVRPEEYILVLPMPNGLAAWRLPRKYQKQTGIRKISTMPKASIMKNP